MFNPPRLGPPSTERPQKRRILLGAQDVPQIHQLDLRGPTSKGREKERGRGKGAIQFLVSTDLVMPLTHFVISTGWNGINDCSTLQCYVIIYSVWVLQTLDVTKTLITSKSLKVSQNVMFTLETRSTKTTGKVSDVWVYQLMTFHFMCWTETLWTFTTNIRLHTFMSPYVYLKVTTVAKFLLTNVTSEPSAFIVWLQ